MRDTTCIHYEPKYMRHAICDVHVFLFDVYIYSVSHTYLMPFFLCGAVSSKKHTHTPAKRQHIRSWPYMHVDMYLYVALTHMTPHITTHMHTPTHLQKKNTLDDTRMPMCIGNLHSHHTTQMHTYAHTRSPAKRRRAFR